MKDYVKQTGWVQVGDTWYYMDASGAWSAIQKTHKPIDKWFIGFIIPTNQNPVNR